MPSHQKGRSGSADVTRPASVIERDANPAPLQSLAAGTRGRGRRGTVAGRRGGKPQAATAEKKGDTCRFGVGPDSRQRSFPEQQQSKTDPTLSPDLPLPPHHLKPSTSCTPTKASPWRPKASRRALRRASAAGGAHLLPLQPLWWRRCPAS